LNAQLLAERLKLDYTTVRHHLFLLEKNRIAITEREKHGKVYFVTQAMEPHEKSGGHLGKHAFLEQED
jgi:DNA-binding transcriptional ArsR family regulator